MTDTEPRTRLFPERWFPTTAVFVSKDGQGVVEAPDDCRKALCDEASALGLVPGTANLTEETLLSLPTVRELSANRRIKEEPDIMAYLSKQPTRASTAVKTSEILSNMVKKPGTSVMRCPNGRSELISIANFIINGSKVFRISQPLSEALSNTDFRVRIGDIRLPFPAIYLLFDLNGLVIHNPDGTSGPLEGALLLDYPDAVREPGGTHLGHIISCIAASRALSDGSTNSMHETLMYGDENRIITNENLSEFLEADHVIAPNVWKVIINSLLYLSSPEAEIDQIGSPSSVLLEARSRATSSKRIAKIDRQLVRTSDLPYALVGKSIVIDRSLRGAPQGQSIDHHWRLGYRVQVRGHWKQQVCGPGRSLRKNIWIRPHWKGPDTAQLVHRDYLLQKRASNEQA